MMSEEHARHRPFQMFRFSAARDSSIASDQNRKARHNAKERKRIEDVIPVHGVMPHFFKRGNSNEELWLPHPNTVAKACSGRQKAEFEALQSYTDDRSRCVWFFP